MSEDAKPAPQSVIKALCRLIDHVDQKWLMENAPRKYLQGHRRIPRNASVLRKNIQAALKAAGGNDDLVNVFLRCASTPEIQVVRLLSTRSITHFFEYLGDSFGRPELLAACWLDDREPVRELVHRHPEVWVDAAVSDEKRAISRDALGKEWQCFSLATLPSDEIHPAAAPSTDQESPAETIDSVKAEESKSNNKQIEATTRRFERKLEKLQRRLEKREEEILRRQNLEKAARERAKLLQDDKDELQRQIVALKSETEERVASAISKVLSLESWRWLGKPREIQAAKLETDANDLPAAARALLARQRAQDLHFGNVKEILTKIEDMQQLIRDLEHAQATALKPLSGLTPMITKLQEEIYRLGQIVKDEPEEPNQVVRQLLARINGAASPVALSRIRAFAEEAASIAILDPDHRTLIEQALNQKHQRLIEPYGVPIPPGEETKWGACYPMIKAMQSNDHCIVLVDGHNVILRHKYLFEQYFEAGRAGPKAREKLSRMIVRIFEGMRSEVVLYFDGASPGVDVLSENIRVIYSGGKGANRADRAILEDLDVRRQRSAEGEHFLVTSDTDLAGRARQKGASVIGADAFGELLALPTL